MTTQRFDPENISLGDLELLETEIGVSLRDFSQLTTIDPEAVAQGNLPPTKLLIALVWLLDRDTYPTLADARRAKITDLMDMAARLEPLSDAEGE